jgi:hypothetical protein
MSKNAAFAEPLFGVIGKTRTQIWDHQSKSHQWPFVIYDPRSRPRTVRASGPHPTSNYDVAGMGFGQRSRINLLASWMMPKLDDRYCELIYQHMKNFEVIYLVGGGVGRWSGINNYMRFIDNNHPHLTRRISPVRHFRITDFPDKKLQRIFKDMS